MLLNPHLTPLQAQTIFLISSYSISYSTRKKFCVISSQKSCSLLHFPFLEFFSFSPPQTLQRLIRLAVHFSHFTSVFVKHTMKYETLYTLRISCEFRVLLMSWKNKPQNPSTFRVNADPGTKWEEQKKGHKTRKKWCEIPRYTFFVFRISQPFSVFRNKCIAGLTAIHG